MSNVVSIDKMEVGHKGGGKHWTKDEIERRQAAAQKLKRKKKIKLKMPDWLDESAAKVWKKTIKDFSGLDILDKVDEDVLAIYCDAVARQREASMNARDGTMLAIENARLAQSYARIVIQYADKLGINPNSRARLAKKIADEKGDPNADLFD